MDVGEGDGGWLCGVRSIRANRGVCTCMYDRSVYIDAGRHGKHQINHLINFAEVTAMVVVNCKKLVCHFAVVYTINLLFFFFSLTLSALLYVYLWKEECTADK